MYFHCNGNIKMFDWITDSDEQGILYVHASCTYLFLWKFWVNLPLSLALFPDYIELSVNSHISSVGFKMKSLQPFFGPVQEECTES